MTLTVGDFASPSLQPQQGAGSAFELKFLIDENLARQIELWGHQELQLDPHGQAALNGGYRTTTLYTDTPRLDVYSKSPKYRTRKYRVRRYGDAEWFYVERKTKHGDKVAKRRSRILTDDLTCLGQPECHPEWDGQWFHQCLLRKQLGPVCQIIYERLAFGGRCDEGPLRLTFDRNIHGAIIGEWALTKDDIGPLLLDGLVIMELKFSTAMPSPFKRLVQDFALTPTTVSKYRLCREKNGATAVLPEESPACPNG